MGAGASAGLSTGISSSSSSLSGGSQFTSSGSSSSQSSLNQANLIAQEMAALQPSINLAVQNALNAQHQVSVTQITATGIQGAGVGAISGTSSGAPSGFSQG